MNIKDILNEGQIINDNINIKSTINTKCSINIEQIPGGKSRLNIEFNKKDIEKQLNDSILSEINKIYGDKYGDFIGSVSQLTIQITNKFYNFDIKK